MFFRLLGLVIVALLAGLLAGRAIAADGHDITIQADAAITQIAPDQSNGPLEDPGDSATEHCFHKLSGRAEHAPDTPFRIQIAIIWVDASTTLQQTHLPPSHPPPVPFA